MAADAALLPVGKPVFKGIYRDGRQTLVWHRLDTQYVELRLLDASGQMAHWTDQHRSLVAAQLAAAAFWRGYQASQCDSTGDLPVE